MDAMHINQQQYVQSTAAIPSNPFSLRCGLMGLTTACAIVMAFFSTQMCFHLSTQHERGLFALIVLSICCGVYLGYRTSAQPQIQAHKWIIWVALVLGIGLHPLSFDLIRHLNGQFLMMHHATLIYAIWLVILMPLLLALPATIIYHHRWHSQRQSQGINLALCGGIFTLTLFYLFNHMHTAFSNLPHWALPTLTLLTSGSLLSFVDPHTLRASQWFRLCVILACVCAYNLSAFQLLH